MKQILGVFKLRIVGLLVFVSVFSMYFSAYGHVDIHNLILLIVAGTLSSAGASAVNNYLDRDIDAKMDRTRGRILPSGKLKPETVLITGIVLTALGVVISLYINPLTAAFVLSGALVYIVLYTLILKRRSWLNIVLGGASGSFAVLAGWSSGSGELSYLALILALVLFLWTPPHFWSFSMVFRRDYLKVKIPMLPVVINHRLSSLIILAHTLALILTSLLLYLLSPLSIWYLIPVIPAGSYFLYLNFRLINDSSYAWKTYKVSGVYLVALFTGIFVGLTL